MRRKVKYAIIGAGTSGLTAMKFIREQTDDIVLINAGAYGTTCARVGCMPSKVLIQIAQDWHRRHIFERFGITGAEALTLDTKAAMSYMRKLRDKFVSDVIKGMGTLSPEQSIAGHAAFIEPMVLQVGEQSIEAERVIIATGSRPVLPEAWKHFGSRMLTSDTLFELGDLPKSITVVGLGVIGLELGQALAQLGVELRGVELTERVGGLSDPDILGYAIKVFGSEFELHLGQAARLEEGDGGSIAVSVGDKRWQADAVLAALGRQPNLAHLGLEKLGAILDQRGVPQYDPQTLQIGDLPVFMAGDVNGFRPILHEAADEGRIAAYNAIHFDQIKRFERRVNLGIAFTHPNIAVVGKPYRDLEPGSFVVGSANFETQSRALAMAANKGLMRLYARSSDKILLGGEMIAPQAEHLAHELSWCIQQQMTPMDILRQPIYHPVLEEGMRTALRELADQLYTPSERLELRMA
jgi:dihydrolipoamide dehydrogenase